MSETKSSLERVLVPEIEVALRPRAGQDKGEVLTVRPFKFGQLRKVLKHVGVLIAYADELGDIDIMAALEGATDEVFALLGLALKREPEFFEDLEMDEGADLAVAMVEVNQDFFVQHVLPKIAEYLPQEITTESAEESQAPTLEEAPLSTEEASTSPSSDLTDPLLGIPEDVIPLEMRITGQNS